VIIDTDERRHPCWLNWLPFHGDNLHHRVYAPCRTTLPADQATEGGARISQRPKPLLERLGWPDVVAIEADMLPAQRGNVGEQVIGQSFGLGAKLGNGVAEVDGAPKDDGGDRVVKARGTVALVFEGAVPDRGCKPKPPKFPSGTFLDLIRSDQALSVKKAHAQILGKPKGTSSVIRTRIAPACKSLKPSLTEFSAVCRLQPQC
jgi:hypothetical protein